MTNSNNGPSPQPQPQPQSSGPAIPPQPPAPAPAHPGDAPGAPPPASVPPAPPHIVGVPARQPGSFRRGFGLGAGAGAGLGVSVLVLGTVLSLLSVLGLVALGAAAGAEEQTDAPVLKTVWGSPSAGKKLRAVDINGPILTDSSGGGLLAMGTYGYEVASMLDELEAKDADGVVLRINTPGGTVTGAKAIADAVARYRQRTGKKVFAHVQGLSASGGMYAMAGADDIRADHGSMVGSIGVIFGPFARYRNVVATDGGILGGGVTTTGGIEQFYLSQGRGKDAGNPFRDLTEEEKAVFNRGLENEYAAFVDHVAAGRKIGAQQIRDDLGAHLFDSKTAQEKRLIDGTMGVDEAYRHFATVAGLDPKDTRLVAPTTPGLVASLLGAEQRVPGQALPLAGQPGVRPVTAAAVCGPAPTVLVYHGDPRGVCG